MVADVNERGAKLFGLSKQQMLGRCLADLLPKKHAAVLTRRYLRVLHKRVSLEEEVENRSGVLRVLWLHHQVVALLDGVAVTLRDISDTRKSKAQLEQLANYDSLTKLPNRPHVPAAPRGGLERCQTNGKKLAVLFIDLDNFKTVNDTLGHDWGDLLLRSVPARLEECLRKGDVVCRLGGDEFTVILEGFQSSEEVSGACQRSSRVWRNPSPSRAATFPPTRASASASIRTMARTSAHCSRTPICDVQSQDGIQGSYQFYVPELSERIAQFVSLEKSLREAMDYAQFFLVFQPKIELKRAKSAEFEALLRWRHPELGLVTGRVYPYCGGYRTDHSLGRIRSA